MRRINNAISWEYFFLFVLKNSKNFLYIKRLNYFCIYFKGIYI